MEETTEKINQHEIQLAKIELSLSSLATETSKIATSVVKQEVILEKLASMKASTDESFKRVHHRVDALEDSQRWTVRTLKWQRRKNSV